MGADGASLGVLFVRIALSLFCVAATCGVQAQAVRKKQLLMSVGGGVGVINLYSDRSDIAVEGLGSGVLRAAFGYAIGKRWSLGIHYDRVGSTWHNKGLDRLHMTTYMLGIAFRPLIWERTAVELEGGFGPSASSLFPLESRLPYTTTSGVINGSVRYIGMFSSTIGGFIAFDHTASSSNELVLEGGLVNVDGTRTRIQWNSPRISAGMVVRF